MTKVIDRRVATSSRGSERASSRGVGRFVGPAARERFVAAYARAMARLPAPAATFDVVTDYGTARVYRFGSASASQTPLMLLPGRTASTPTWAPNLAGLMAERTVYCVDLIGEAGMSMQTRPIRTAGQQAQWLDQALAELGLARAHLVGVSFGGWVAFQQALHRPARVASIVLLDPVSVLARFSWRAIVVSLGMLPGVPDRVRRRLLRWMAAGAELDDDDPVERLIASSMRDFRAKLPAPTVPRDDELRRVPVPVAVLLAGRSIIHDARHAKARARALLRDGHVELWPEASHAVSGELPDRVDRFVLDAASRADADAQQPVSG